MHIENAPKSTFSRRRKEKKNKSKKKDVGVFLFDTPKLFFSLLLEGVYHYDLELAE